MRRKDRLISEEAAMEAAKKCMWATVALTDLENMPYCVAVSPVVDGNAMYFHCAREGYKTDCLRNNPNVCVSCVAEAKPVPQKFAMEYTSAIIRGKASEVQSFSEKVKALKLIAEKYSPGFDSEEEIRKAFGAVCIIRIDIERISGKQAKF